MFYSCDDYKMLTKHFTGALPGPLNTQLIAVMTDLAPFTSCSRCSRPAPIFFLCLTEEPSEAAPIFGPGHRWSSHWERL